MFKDIIELVFLENRIADYLIFVSLFLAAFGMIKIFQFFIIRQLKKWAEKTATTIDDFLLKIIQRAFPNPATVSARKRMWNP